jgi:hypothetical protein
MVVHHVEVDQVSTGRFDCPHLFSEPCEIGRQNARRNPDRLNVSPRLKRGFPGIGHEQCAAK